MNHDIPTATVAPVEAIESSHEQDDRTKADFVGVALVAVAEGQVHPVIERMKKVERAFFGSPDELIRQITEGEIGIDDTDFEERTAVMMMTAQGHTEAVKWLIAHGANLNRINMYQGRIPMSALDAARQTNRKILEQLLRDNGAKSGQEIRAEQLAVEQDE